MSISYPLALLDLLAFADSSTADNTLASRAVSECVHKGIIYARNYSYEGGLYSSTAAISAIKLRRALLSLLSQWGDT